MGCLKEVKKNWKIAMLDFRKNWFFLKSVWEASDYGCQLHQLSKKSKNWYICSKRFPRKIYQKNQKIDIFAWKGFRAGYIDKIKKSIYLLEKVSKQDKLIKSKNWYINLHDLLHWFLLLICCSTLFHQKIFSNFLL